MYPRVAPLHGIRAQSFVVRHNSARLCATRNYNPTKRLVSTMHVVILMRKDIALRYVFFFRSDLECSPRTACKPTAACVSTPWLIVGRVVFPRSRVRLSTPMAGTCPSVPLCCWFGVQLDRFLSTPHRPGSFGFDTPF